MKKSTVLVLVVANILIVNAQNTINYAPKHNETGLLNETVTDELNNSSVNLLVGKTPASHSVSQSGFFNYEVPIRIPKGTNGMEPNISLVYNSQAGNGIAGYGWSIGGLSSITKTNKTIYHDGNVENAAGSTTSPYALNGNRLIPIQGANGLDGTIYKTENENFSKVTSFSQPQMHPNLIWFKVESKNGIVSEYGKNINSVKTFNSHGAGAFFNISKTIDRNGNYIEYHYTNINGETLISEIKYTGNNVAGLMPYASIKFNYKNRNDVNTIYAIDNLTIKNRNILESIQVMYDGTNQYKKYKLTYSDDFYSHLIQINEEGSIAGEELIPLKFSYYDSQNQFQQIQTNFTHGANFEYFPGDFNGDGLSDILRVHTFTTYLNEKFYMTYEILINNNGVFTAPTQITNISSGMLLNKGINSDNTHKNGLIHFELGDFNGDGKTDITFTEAFRGGSGSSKLHYILDIKIAYSNCSSGTINFNTVGYSAPPIYNFIGERNSFVVGDFNGDGASDIFMNLHDNDNNDYGVSGSNIYQMNILMPLVNTQFNLINGISDHDKNKFSYKDKIEIMDFNGDGKSDIMQMFEHSSNNKTIVHNFTYSSSSNSFLTNLLYNDDHGNIAYANTPNKGDVYKKGDFNGDGKTDIMVTSDADLVNWEIYLSDGEKYKFGGNFTYDISVPNHRLHLADLNGDGKSDILFVRNTTVVTNNTSTSYSHISIDYAKGYNESIWKVLFENYQRSVTNNATINDEVKFGDFLGTGATNLLTVFNPSTYLNILDFTNRKKIGQLKYISSGYKEITKIKYQSISDQTNACEGLYSPTTISASYPIQDFHKPIYVAKSVDIPDASGSNNLNTHRLVTNYFYTGAKLHMQGKGFLGFEKLETETTAINPTEPVPLVRGTVENELDFNYYFLRTKTARTEIINDDVCKLNRMPTNLLARKEFHYSTISLSNNRFINQLNQTLNVENIYGKTTLTDYYYNSTADTENGNVSQIISTIGGNGSVETITTDIGYSNFGTHIPAHPVSKIITKIRNSEAPFIQKFYFNYSPTTGNLIEETQRDKNDHDLKRINYDYGMNNFGLVEEKTSTIANHSITTRITKYEFDQKGRFLLKRYNPQNYLEIWTYNALLGLPNHYDPPGADYYNYDYDSFGRKITEQDQYGIISNHLLAFDEAVSSNNYEPKNTLYKNKITTPGFGEGTVWYDHRGNIRKTKTSGFNADTYTVTNYTTVGKKANHFDEFFGTTIENETTFEYDLMGRLIMSETKSQNNTLLNRTLISHPDNSFQTGNLIAENRTTSTTITDLNGRSKTTTTDPTGKQISVADPGGTLYYKYNSNDALTEVKLENTVLSTMEYDINGFQSTLIEPNSGTTQYTYNILGELINQIDANGNETDFEYDILGRLVSKNVNGIESYLYNYNNNGNGIGKINSEKAVHNNIENQYSYNLNGELESITEKINNKLFTTSFTYVNGRIESEEYHHFSQSLPTKTKYTYTSNGFLENVLNENLIGTTNDFFIGVEKNAKNQWMEYERIDGITTISYNQSNMANGINSPTYNRAYDFEITTGNLLLRSKDADLVEKFSYDINDRLIQTELNDQTVLTMDYADNGNIEFKSDVGGYSYLPERQNAVFEIENIQNEINTSTQDIEYNAQHNPTKIIEGDFEYSFLYGPNHQRKMMSMKNITTLETTHRYYTTTSEYLFDQQHDALLYQVDYIGGGDGLCAMVVYDGNLSNAYSAYTDYLGSIELLTDANGNVIAEQSFDPWGRSRNPYSWEALGNYVLNTPDWLWRGFTGHEHLSQFQLINMNGRMYDPLLGRMLSPDNFVQDNTYTQNYNRYTYALNNPLKYTDPNGEWVHLAVGAVIGGFSGYQMGKANGAKGWDMFAYIAGGAAIGAASGGAASGVSAAGGGAFISGAVGGAVGGGGFAALGGGNAGDIAKGAGIGFISGGIGGTFGAAIGGGGGAFAGGAVGSGLNAKLHGASWEQAGISALAGGGLAFGTYHASSYLNYQFRGGNSMGGLDIKYNQYLKMQAAYQRSRFDKKEHGFWLTKDGTTPEIVGNAYDLDLGAVPNGAIAEFHTHWDRPGLIIVQDAKGGPWMYKSEFQMMHAGKTNIAVRQSQTYQHHSPMDIGHGYNSLVINRYDASFYPGTGGISNVQPFSASINRFVYSFYFW